MMYDLIIVGAGPVGLMLANLTQQQSNCSILLIEKQLSSLPWSRAIGVTPPTVELFRSLGLAKELVDKGVSITTAVVHSRTSVLGKLSFDALPSAQKSILSIPQYETDGLLENNLKKYPHVTILRGAEVTGVSQNDTAVVVDYTMNNETHQATSRYLAGCDGSQSIVRTCVGIARKGGRYRDTFVMADFMDRTTLGNEAHLFFTALGAVESFPLPEGKRRWVVQSKKYVNSPDAQVHCALILERTGFSVQPEDLIHLSPFGVQHYVNNSYYQGNIFFCGDSAHVMSPIGGQGMNTGFGDAEFLATILARSLEQGSLDEKLCQLYETCRKEAARSALTRAWLSMRIGTAQGVVAPLRDLFLRVILNTPIRVWGARHFAMLTIPCGTLISAQKRRPKLSRMLSMHKSHP